MPVSRMSILLKSLRQLGLKPLALLAVYHFGMLSGHYRRVTPPGPPLVSGMKAPVLLNLEQPGPLHIPDREQLLALLGEEGRAAAIARADEVVNGQVILFGGEPRPIELYAPAPILHRTEYKSTLASPNGKIDIKFTWEQGRLGWIYPLARAYILSGDERYPQVFWKYTEEFLQANPANLGPHWSSAQEVAIRLLSLLFGGQVFRASPHTTEERLHLLSLAVAAHAARIPPTLVYARAQNNNHLITEALGLLAAGLALPGHSSSGMWADSGWRWLTWALENQVSPDGSYVQYSTNYHRLMLQAVLWAQSLLRHQGKSLPPAICQRLSAAANWLLNRTDPASGDAANYGANDGAYLFPLAGGSWRDFRPVIQAAGRAFGGKFVLPAGAWDEMSLWFGVLDSKDRDSAHEPLSVTKDPARLQDPTSRSWARLNAVHYSNRPSHADQLHVDLWWQGTPISHDAGTYLYNADPPWDNSLAGTAFHNTISIDDVDQMLHAGRFLWLDWAQGRYLAPLTNQTSLPQISAEHNGYDRLGVRHIRTVTLLEPGRWLIQDSLVPSAAPRKGPHKAVLHWLLPDWTWQMAVTHLLIHGQPGRVEIEVKTEKSSSEQQVTPMLGLARAGVLIAGRGAVRPQHGWFSVVYGEKQPALSLLAVVESALPVEISTTFTLVPENP